MPRHAPPPEFIWSKDFTKVKPVVILGPMPPYTPQKQLKPDPLLPTYLRALYDYPLLNKAQERHLFRKYNYLRWKMSRARKPELYRDMLKETSDLILTSNLRLVVHLAKKYKSGDLFECISAGNLGLVRAMRGYDYTKGLKFSTYASNAIIMSFRTAWRNDRRYEDRFKIVEDADGVDPIDDHFGEAERHAEQAEAAEIAHNLWRCLTDERQRYVIKERFGIGTEKKTLLEVSQVLGVTRERVRQIESRAIQELRFYASVSLGSDVLSLKSGCNFSYGDTDELVKVPN